MALFISLLFVRSRLQRTKYPKTIPLSDVFWIALFVSSLIPLFTEAGKFNLAFLLIVALLVYAGFARYR